MAGSKGIRAGKAYVELTANDNQLVRGLRSAQRKLKAFGASITRMGASLLASAAAVAGPILIATKQFASFGDQVNKASIRTGLSAKSISSLGFAAEQSGADIETLEGGFRGMARTLLNAERGLSTAVDSLDELGLSTKDFQGLNPEEQFILLADRIAQIEDPTKRAAIAMNIFGRAGQKLVPLLSGGAAGIKALQQEAESLGITLSDEDAQAAADLTDAMNRMKRAMSAAWLSGGMALSEGMTKFANAMAKVLANVGRYVRENRKFITGVALAATVVAGVGAALVSAGVIIVALSFALGGLVSAVSATIAVLAFLATPFGAVIAALTVVTAIVIRAAVAFSWLQNMFRTLFPNFQGVLSDIAAALTNGNVATAAKLFWAYLELAWARGTEALSVIWWGFLEGMWRAFRDVFAKIASFMPGSKFLSEAILTINLEDIVGKYGNPDSVTEAQKRLDNAREEANSITPQKSSSGGFGSGTDLDDILESINSAVNMGVPSMAGAGGTFSSMSSRIFGAEPTLTRAEEMIIKRLERINKTIEDEGMGP